MPSLVFVTNDINLMEVALMTWAAIVGDNSATTANAAGTLAKPEVIGEDGRQNLK